VKLKRFQIAKPKVGLVLGSGAARGWSHIGVIKAFRDHQIPIHIITGTSAGAVVGAFLAADAIENLERFTLSHKSLKDTFSYMDFTINNGGLVAGKKFMKFLEEHLPVRKFSELKIPFGVVATDLITFSEIHIDDGFLIPAIRASVAVPGFLTPLESQGMQLVDGGLVNPVPVNLARQLGADIVISVDLNAHNANLKVKSFMGILDRTVSVLMNKVREANMEKFPADITITPDLSHYKFMDYHKTNEAIQIGYDSAMEKIPEIKKILSNPISKYKKAVLGNRALHLFVTSNKKKK